MIIFKPTQMLMRLFGYLYTYSDAKWYRWYNYVVYTLTCLLFIPICAFIYANHTDVAVLAETLSLTTGEWNAMIKGLVFILNRDKIKHLLIELQRIVDQKEREDLTKRYGTMNKVASFWARIDIATMTNSIFSISLGPIMLVLYHYWMGDLRPDMLRQPVGLVFPFDIYRSPTYEIIYVMVVIIITCIGYTIALTDCFFMGVCSQIIACQMDLQDMLRDIASADTNRKHHRWIDVNENNKINNKLIECVKFHNDILSYVNTLGQVSSPIIFAQFLLSVVQMCTLFFVIQEGKNVAIDRYIANVITSIVALSELFIYCYYGNEVSYQGITITDAAYDSGWYKCSPKQRRYVFFIMMRAGRVQNFTGFHFVNCSLESYTSVLNMVGSALALLRSVV